MYKYPSIDSLRHASKYAEKYLESPVVHYEGTVKIHGTNCSVVCTPDALIAQSRNRTITPENDNAGFAAHVAKAETQRVIRSIEDLIRHNAPRCDTPMPADAPLVLFGEWCGPGIQKGVAVNALAKKQWVLFGASVDRGDGLEQRRWLPLLGNTYGDSQVYSARDGGLWSITINFSDPRDLESTVAQIAGHVEHVERACPWAARFGIAGTGEGIVWQPLGDHHGIEGLVFKTKGAKHKTEGSPRKEAADPLVVANTEQFVSMFVTEPRLQQGLEFLRESGLEVSMSSTGAFLKWIGQDIQREGRLELEANGLTWKQVARAVSQSSLEWFKGVA